MTDVSEILAQIEAERKEAEEKRTSGRKTVLSKEQKREIWKDKGKWNRLAWKWKGNGF